MKKNLLLALLSLAMCSPVVYAQTTYLDLSGFGKSGSAITNKTIGTYSTTFSAATGGTSRGNNYGGDNNGNFNASTLTDATSSTSVINFTFSRPVTVILSWNTTTTMGNFDYPDQWQLSFTGSYSFYDPNGSFGAAGTRTGTDALTFSPTPAAAPANTNLADAA